MKNNASFVYGLCLAFLSLLALSHSIQRSEAEVILPLRPVFTQQSGFNHEKGLVETYQHWILLNNKQIVGFSYDRKSKKHAFYAGKVSAKLFAELKDDILKSKLIGKSLPVPELAYNGNAAFDLLTLFTPKTRTDLRDEGVHPDDPLTIAKQKFGAVLVAKIRKVNQNDMTGAFKIINNMLKGDEQANQEALTFCLSSQRFAHGLKPAFEAFIKRSKNSKHKKIAALLVAQWNEKK